MNYEVLCSPVSGSNFPCQIALIKELTIARQKIYGKTKKLNLGLGSSGGNLAIYLLNLAGEDTDKLVEFSRKINSKYFARSWYPKYLNFMPNITGYLFKGTIYKEGIDTYELYDNMYSEEGFELWSGTYNMDESKAQFFCNKSRFESEINQVFFSQEQETYGLASFIYCNGNKKMICDSIIASASIPFIVPAAKINGVSYGDGGVMYASPLSVFYKEIYRIVNGNYSHEVRSLYYDIPEIEDNKSFVLSEYNEDQVKNLRLYYIMDSHPVNNDSSTSLYFNYLYSGLRASSLKDKSTAINLLNLLSPSGIETQKFLYLNNQALTDIIILYDKYKHYVLCLYPHTNSDISLSDFDGLDILRNIEITSRGYGCQIWYSVELKE